MVSLLDEEAHINCLDRFLFALKYMRIEYIEIDGKWN